MANYTITYSPNQNGWTSYHSYEPEWMVTMNNFLYTFKAGNLYKHNSNQTRNSYYVFDNNASVTRFTIDSNGAAKFYSSLTAASYFVSSLNTPPATSSSTGTIGEIRYDVSYIYVCTGTNTWKRATLSTW
jgi:hypothetical protein